MSDTPPNPFVSLLGPTLIQDVKGKKQVKTINAVKNKELVLLYFSASWCPPCKAFSPLLKEFYQATKDRIEIVYVSSDSTVAEFEGYFGSMPWLSLPIDGAAPIKNKLAQTMQIRGIPALVVLNAKTGHFVTDQAREQVTASLKSKSGKKEAMTQLLHTWHVETEAVPLDQAKFNGGAGAGPQGLWAIVMALLKNPAAIFALLYFVKWFMRQYKELMAGSGDDGTDGGGGALMEDGTADDGQTEF